MPTDDEMPDPDFILPDRFTPEEIQELQTAVDEGRISRELAQKILGIEDEVVDLYPEYYRRRPNAGSAGPTEQT